MNQDLKKYTKAELISKLNQYKIQIIENKNNQALKIVSTIFINIILLLLF
jgi:hypothetical protein